MRTRLRATVSMIALAISASVSHAGSFEDFFKALSLDDASTVARLVQRGFDVNARDERGQPALLLAMHEGSFKVAEGLLGNPQLEVDAANAVGETALMIAALKGHLDAARRLLERGARPERNGWNPLHYAATGPNPAVVKLLLERGVAIDARSPNGSTALMMAARYGTEDAVKILLAGGANARLRNDLGLQAGDFARSAGRESLAAALDTASR